MDDEREPASRPGEVVPEVRTRRLVVVDEAGVERAVVQLRHGIIEITVGGEPAEAPCQVVLFAGEDEPGHHAAGLELRANGDSVAGCTITIVGRQVEHHLFGPDAVDVG